jgi:hypothetical protein
MVVGELDPEHGAGEDGNDLSLELDCFFRIHGVFAKPAPFAERRFALFKSPVSGEHLKIGADALRERGLH